MASKFKVKQQAKREALGQKLVSSFLPGLQASDPANFDLAFSFVAQNLADPGRSVHTLAADEWFDSMALRCDLDSQFAKAGRIRTLVTEIKQAALGYKSDYADVEYRILTLLMLLAERPLDSSLERATALVRQVNEQRLAEEAAVAGARAREEAELLAIIRAEASSDSEQEQEQGAIRGGRGAYGSSSSLSDWSEDMRVAGDRAGRERSCRPTAVRGGGDTLSTPTRQTRTGGFVVPPGAQVASPGPSSLPQRDATGQILTQLTLQPWLQPQSTAQPQPLRPVMADPPPSAGRQRLPPRRLLAPTGSLRARLVAAAGLPLRVAGGVTPLPRVLLALLAALQGRSSEEIPWDPVKCSFLPTDDLCLAVDVSYGAVRAAVRPLIRAATGIRRLNDWAQICLHRHGSGAPPTAAAAAAPPSASGTAVSGRRTPLDGVAAAGAGGGGSGSGGVEGSLEVPAWLLDAAGVKGRTILRLVQGPTLQALHKAVSSCLHALRAPLVELEQKVTSAAAAMVAATAITGDGTCWQRDNDPSGLPPPSLPSLYELVLSCQPYMRRAAGLVTAYLEVAKPLLTQLAAAPSPVTPSGPAAAASGTDAGLTPRLRSSAPAASGTSATGTPVAAASIGRSAVLQLQSSLVLERLHAMNERGWLDGVFRPLESHAHRCMLLYLYLCALAPLLDGLAEWLWNGGTGSTAGTAAPAGAATGPGSGTGSGGSELPADFFIVRGGGPGREVPPDHPAFWREGYVALTRPPPPAAAGTTTTHPGGAYAGAAIGSGSSAAAAPSGQYGPSYLCPPFLEPLVPIIMAAGKSLRLRQREADSLEAAATTTAGAAGPGYGSAGSAVLDPVVLEESYAMYGLDPEDEHALYGRAGGWVGGGHDLKHGLMERLMSYITSPGLQPSVQKDDPFVISARSNVYWQREQATPRVPQLGTPAAVVSGTAAVGYPQAGSGTSRAVAESEVAAAGGLWTRMATASARLRALCQGGECDYGDSDSPGQGGGYNYADGNRGGGSGIRLVGGGDGLDIGGMGMAMAAIRPVRAPRPVSTAAAGPGNVSPVTPLDCGGGSGGSSPGDEAARRQQVGQQTNSRKPGLMQLQGAQGDSAAGSPGGTEGGGGTGGGEVAQLGGWWPRRCDLLLQWASGPEAAFGSCGANGHGSVPHHAGPWHKIHQQLRAGPGAALTGVISTRFKGSYRAHVFSGISQCWGRTTAIDTNAYQHPALDLLLMHACGHAPPPSEAASVAAGAAHTRRGGGGGLKAPLHLPAHLPASAVTTPLGLPHTQELLRRGLVEPLQDRAYHVNDALLLKLLSGWGLETRLMALPAVFLLSSPAVRSWADRLVSALLGGMRLGEPPLEEHQLESMLQEALASAGADDVLPPPSSLVLSLTPAAGQETGGGGAGGPAAPTAAGSSRAGPAKAGLGVQQEPPKFQAVQELDRSVAELERLQLGVAPSWVVALIADARVLRAYSQALVFMLQLRWVRTALDTAHKSSCLAWRERETRAHPNSWRPLRGGHDAAPAPLQRALSAGVADTAAATLAVAAVGVGGGGVRGSSSSNSLLSGLAAAAARNAQPAAGAVSSGNLADAVPGVGGGAGGLPSAASSARLQASLAAMLHFMATLEQWVATQLVHDAWAQLMMDLNASRNLDDVCEAHTAYTVTLLRRCFRYSGEEGSRHMGAALRKCLDACLRFAAAVSSLTGGGAAKVAAGALPNTLAAQLQEEALHAASQFSYWLGYLVRFVSTRALLSPSSDLGDLLMRLNYNDCYSAHFMPEELVAQQLAAQHCATAAARGWAALGPGPNPNPNPNPPIGIGPGSTRTGILGAAPAAGPTFPREPTWTQIPLPLTSRRPSQG
ncbi:hypothetical protein VaNZ11_001016 [Volvox africanus]|uniref:Gamma tubulin complex component C-terminal domain-containing protein n=1 Tax=Volvox africanus TaxID=51714 RepID=A0ABQ5RNT2_9CHLO|nr:hypothetical protein VaNZ11_001016 [Volvox africanus]